MSLQLIKDYQKALDAIYEHVGLKEEWVVCPLDERIDSYWDTDGKIVRFADSIEQFYSNGDYYQDDIYTQRFYDKHIFEGKDFTLIFCDPHTDGMKWWRLFDNKKRVDLKLERKVKIDKIEKGN